LATALNEAAFFLICIDLQRDFYVWRIKPKQLPQLFATAALYNRSVLQKDRKLDE